MQRTISQAVEKYLLYCESLIAKSTAENYRRRLGKFFLWLKDKEFCLDSVDEYRQYQQNKIKPSTIDLELRVLRSFISYLHKRDYFKTNWGVHIDLPKLKRKVEFVPTQEQAIEAIILGTEPGEGDNKLSRKRKLVARNALTFIVLTGIRQYELQTLKVEDIDIHNHEFKVLSKGGHEDKLPFRKALTEMLKDTLSKREPNERLFDCTQKHLNKSMKKGCEKLGISKITVHKLRKVFGTDLARKNINPFLIARLLRHTNIKTTYDNYIRNNIDDLKLAVNSTQGSGKFMNPKEVIHLLLNQVDASGLREANFLTISESGSTFSLTINKA